jgi:hypothetical protein
MRRELRDDAKKEPKEANAVRRLGVQDGVVCANEVLILN